MARRGFYDNRRIELKSRKEEKKKRASRMIIFYVVAAVCILASYPVGCKVYNDVVIESDKELNVIPNWMLNLLPSGLIGTIMGG